MNQADMFNMLQNRVQQMEGGKRRVGRPRKYRGGEQVEGYEMDTMGSGLVGGKRRVGRPRKGVIPPQFLAHIAALRRKRARSSRGRGLVGGSAEAQDIYEYYAEAGQEIPDEIFKLMKAGIKPVSAKSLVIKKIQRLEKKIGLSHTSTEHLKKYTMLALKKIAEFYDLNGEVLAYPPVKGVRDDEDEERFETARYVLPDKQAGPRSDVRRRSPDKLTEFLQIQEQEEA